MIFLVQINFSEDHSEKILPLGILSIGSALKKNNYEVELININEKEIKEIAQKIASKNPEFVGISVMTGIQTKHSAELSRQIKRIKNIPILWGGIHPSLLPQQCLEEEYIDFVMIGEGEETILEFVRVSRQGNNFSGVLGLGYKRDGRQIINQRRFLIANLDNWRLDFSLFDMNKYVFKLGPYKKVMAYKTSRGCPFNCAFCYNNDFNLSRWRVWSAKTVIEDIDFLKEKYKIDAIKFYDDNFFVDKKRAIEILRAINIPSHLEIRIDAIDDNIARELKELKVFDMLIGLESGSNRLLQLIDKRFTVDQLFSGVKSIAKYNLHATYSFIVGLPTESKEEFQQTIDLMYKIYQIHPRAGFTLGAYLPYPGSKMYKFSIQQGFKSPVRTEDWGMIDRFRKNFESPWVNIKKVWIIRECFKLLSWDLKIIKKWFEFRIKNNFYSWPMDIYLIEFLAGIAIAEKSLIGKLLRKFYNFLRFKKVKNNENLNDKFFGGKFLSGRVYPEFFPINQTETVLNVGCGKGIQAITYKASFKKMIGVDINQERLEASKELMNFHNIDNFETLCANVQSIPLDQKFDKAVAVDIVEHVIHPDIFIKEINRLLKDEGQLLITFPAVHDKWENFFSFVGRKILRRKGKTIRKAGWDPDEHQYDYGINDWLKLMEKGSFILVNSRATTLFPPLHYLGLPKFWFSNDLIHKVDSFLCRLPLLKNYGQALVCIFEKKKT